MDKERVIFFLQMLCAFVVTILFCGQLDAWDDSKVIPFGETASLVVLMICIALLEIWRTNIIYARHPFNSKKVGAVLGAIAEDKTGTKELFIENFGEEMYQFFLKRGYIHELAKKDDEKGDYVWEITKLGLRRKVELCS